MKKLSIIICTVLIAFAMAACGGLNTAAVPDSDTASEFSASRESSATAGSTKPERPSEYGQETTTDENIAASAAPPEASQTRSDSTAQPVTTTQNATPPQSTTTSKSIITTTTKAIIPTITARATAQTVTTTRKKATTTAAPTTTLPPFDANSWVQFAKEYAVSIGFELSKGTMGTWDNPIGIGPGLKYMERDIKGVLEWYKREGYVSVWVWAEKRPNSDRYDLYISRG